MNDNFNLQNFINHFKDRYVNGGGWISFNDVKIKGSSMVYNDVVCINLDKLLTPSLITYDNIIKLGRYIDEIYKFYLNNDYEDYTLLFYMEGINISHDTTHIGHIIWRGLQTDYRYYINMKANPIILEKIL